jgi:hypothetical protein
MKRILFLIIILLLFSGIALGYELGAGSGTGYPGAIDTDTSIEVDYPSPLATTARSAVPNDTNAAVIAIETELGINPSGTYDTIKARLDAGDGLYYLKTEINTQAKMEAIWVVSLVNDGDLDLYYLKTSIDTLPEMEAIWVLDIITSTELSTALGSYYLKTAIDTQAEMEEIWGITLATDLELAALKFTDLTDTPANYTGSSLKFARVNVGETALEFAVEADPNVDTDAEIKAILVDEITKTGAFTAGKIAKINNATGIIEEGTNTDTDVADAVTKKHSQNTDTQFDFYNALASDHTWSGEIDTQLVGMSVAFGDLLYFNWTDKEWKKAQATGSNTMPGLRIALETKIDGDTCKMLVKGYLRDDSAFEFAGAMIYVSAATAGLMTSTAPSTTGQQVQRVGVAKSADILFFSPSIDVGEI